MGAIPNHHGRPVLTRVVDIVGLQRCADIFPVVFCLVIVLDDLHGLVRVEQFQQFVDVLGDDHVAVTEQRGAVKPVQVRHQVARENKPVAAILLAVKAVEHGLMQGDERHRHPGVFDHALTESVVDTRLAGVVSDVNGYHFLDPLC